MQTITRAVYVTADGTEFTDREKAERYDAAITAALRAMSRLGDPITDTNFANGDGFVQHDPRTVESVKATLIEACRPVLGYGPGTSFMMAARYASDSGYRGMGRLFTRLMCIDAQGREWGQPYYALNPHQGRQVRLR